ncbi:MULTISPECIES: metallophosphoesterase [Clostridium]|uniref:Metallophosphoesterase n=1 Tax=Clostridium frigoriphilum TaxID=443253 RepID=A0ABU7UVM2_9CLOT|nr:metallophosphoesterase [Clostridium sp. DSM 17811]MBU3101889.1 metallophosphoesterase [Clostridium sp. DSM 17811]
MKIKKFSKLVSIIIALTLTVSLYSSATVYADTTRNNNYIGVTSDIHGNISNLTTWLSNLKNTSTSLDYMIFGGDYAGPKDAASCTSAVSSQYKGTSSILTKGNHEVGKGGTYASGLVVNNSNYAVYVMDSSSKSFTTTDMDNIKSSLNSINPSTPVFVVSHCPIHYFKKRTTGNASTLVNLLNNHSNVIFIWGHNHTVHDTNYGKVKISGDTIQCSSSTSVVPIKFTYANMGAMKQGNNGAYGLLINLIKESDSTKIKFDYKDLSGKTVSNYSVTIS